MKPDNSGGGKGPQLKTDARSNEDRGIDDESSHPELCSEVADGVTRNIVCLFREPDAGNLPVRFDEREQETEPSQTGLRWRGESYVEYPPGDYSHCACSRLYSRFHSSTQYSKPFGDRTLGLGLVCRNKEPLRVVVAKGLAGSAKVETVHCLS